ncbi:hypothetical protein ACWKW9_20005, partial [Rhizobium daejeonense]
HENPSQHFSPWPPQRYGCHTLSTGPSSTGEKSMSAYRVGFIVMLTLVSIAFVAVVWPFFLQSYGLWFSRLSFFRSMLALNVP